MTVRPALLWFRDDLRLSDNPALRAALDHGPLICLYILDTSTQRRPLGGAARWWLSRSLRALSETIAAKGGELLVLLGDPAELLPDVVRAADVGYVAWNRRYDDAAIALDKAMKATLTEAGIAVESFNANLLNEPWQVKTKADGPFKVFTPYWRAVREGGEPSAPLPAPARLSKARLPAALREQALTVADLTLEPTTPDWAGGLRDAWTPGEDGARDRLDAFLDETIAGYREARDLPDRTSTSRLSPHLRFGEISPRQIWHATQAAREAGNTPGSAADVEKFFSEIGWREFSYHLLFHNPDLASVNYDRRFDAMVWETDEAGLKAWQKGMTGYPIVDAGLRELWQTGWMHNRVRMITASFLIKHLLTDWRTGEAWFWDTLVDADPANNPASWQWVAGSGADAAPYFRVFNPVTQGEKFDPKGAYVRRFVPELAELGDKFVHRPWEAPASVLTKAGIVVGQNYPKPVVALDFGRRRALDAFAALRSE